MTAAIQVLLEIGRLTWQPNQNGIKEFELDKWLLANSGSTESDWEAKHQCDISKIRSNTTKQKELRDHRFANNLVITILTCIAVILNWIVVPAIIAVTLGLVLHEHFAARFFFGLCMVLITKIMSYL